MAPGIIDLMGDIQVPDCDIIDGESDCMPDYMSDYTEDPEFPDYIGNEKSDINTNI